MHSILAFLRHDALTAASYRLNSVLSLLSLAVTALPLYFIADALQPVMGPRIEGQGERYFGFVLLGTLALRWVTSTMTALPAAVSGAIRQGRFETLLLAPGSTPQLLAGMVSYTVAWVLVESAVMLGVGAALGLRYAWLQLPWAVLVLVLLSLAYAGVGLVASTLQLRFRTSGPLLNGAIVISIFFGGVYYPTTAIPAWMGWMAELVPLTYGLRAVRGLLLEGLPPTAVGADIAVLAVMTAVVLAGSLAGFEAALRHARRAGTLAQY